MRGSGQVARLGKLLWQRFGEHAAGHSEGAYASVMESCSGQGGVAKRFMQTYTASQSASQVSAAGSPAQAYGTHTLHACPSHAAPVSAAAFDPRCLALLIFLASEAVIGAACWSEQPCTLHLRRA